jgi:hypothetical protein
VVEGTVCSPRKSESMVRRLSFSKRLRPVYFPQFLPRHDERSSHHAPSRRHLKDNRDYACSGQP